MSIAVFAVVLVAAALHATWNAIVKGGSDKLMTTVLVIGVAALIALVVLPVLPAPARASWPPIFGSTMIHIAYFVLVAHAYRATDMSQAYPLMRGTAPLLVALASARLLDEPLSTPAWVGIGILCGGILGMAAGIRRDEGRAGMVFAFLNALVIATYTVLDGYGARRSGAPASYTLWIFLLTGLPLLAWALALRRDAFPSYVARNWRLGLIGGIGTVASYSLVLWAMTVAPVAVVAALREVSILFGAAISGLLLRESLGPARIGAVCVIAAGAAILRLA